MRTDAEELGRFDVAVVGAGPVGACCAWELARRGARVAVVDPGDGWGSECANASAGWVCPSFSGPFASRADVWHAVRWLARRDSPLAVRPSPGLLTWLARLLHATRSSTAARCAEVLRELSTRSLAMHASLAAGGLETGFRARGLLDVYTTTQGHAEGLERARAHVAAGGAAEPLDAHQARSLEPALGPHVAGAVLYPAEADCVPAQFVAAVGSAAERAGAALLTGGRVLYIDAAATGVGLRIPAGVVRAERVVVAAGSWTPALVRRFGRLPVRSGKGYAIDVGAPTVDIGLRRPLYLHEQRVAVTPFERSTRLAGTLELGGRPSSVDPRRVAGIARSAREALPALPAIARGAVGSGLRPCTPDGLPAVGPVDPEGRVHVATGHAMLGITLAPVTGALVGELLDGPVADPLLTALDPGRFASMPTTARRGL